MRKDVKPRRRSDSQRRQAQAAHTRRDLLAAAHQLFLQRGYAGATLAA
jgi:AcrR family transcriptional regulator